MARTDQRAHHRHTISRDVLLVLPGLAPASARMLNTCIGGCLLGNIRDRTVLGALAEDPASLVEICLFDEDDNMIRLMGQQRRVADSTLGVQFLEAQERLVDYLLLASSRAGGDEPIAHRGMPGQSRSHQHPQAAADRLWLLQFGRQFFATLIDNFLVQCFEHKQKLILRGVHDALAQRIEATYRQLLKHKMMLTEGLQNSFEENLSSLGSQSTTKVNAADKPSAALSDLRLLEKDEFENWLEFQLIAAAVAGSHNRYLYTVQQRLSAMLDAALTAENNPFGPAMVGHLMRDVIQRQEIVLDARSFMFSSYQDALSALLREELPVLDSYLKRQGYLALAPEQIRTQWPRQANDRSVPSVSDAGALQQEEDYDSYPQAALKPFTFDDDIVIENPRQTLGNNSAGALFEMLSLSQSLADGRTGGSGVPPLALVGRSAEQARNEITQEDIDSCQRYLEQHDQRLGQELEDYDSVLTGVLESLPQEGLTPRQHTLLHTRARLVEKLFQAIDTLEQVPERLRPLMARLKLPMLKMVLQDVTFFEDSRHPLRKIMNNFMSLAINDRTAGDTLPDLLEDIVGRLETSGHDRQVDLEAINQRLSQLVIRQARAFERTVDRVAKLHEGREKMQLAREWVQHQLSSLLQGRKVPVLVLNILAAGLEQIIILCYLRHGPASAEVAKKLEIVAQLQLWLSALPDDKPALFEMELEGRSLVESIEHAFEDFGLQHQGKGVIDELHERIFHGGRSELLHMQQYRLVSQEPLQRSDTPGMSDKPAASGSVGQLGAANPAPTALPKRWLERIEALEIGQWVSYTVSGCGAQKLKLIWMDRKRSTFIFLSPRGMAEKQFSRTALLNMLHTGELTLLREAGRPFSDQSLFKVIEDLYQRNVSEAVHDPLTGCMTRTEFAKQLDQKLLQLKRTTGREAVIIFFNIDAFSLLNDNFGLEVGDAVLKAIPNIVDAAVSDIRASVEGPGTERFLMGRLGSDEFAVLIDPCSVAEGDRAANEILAALAARSFGGAKEAASFHIGASIGLLPLGRGSGDSASVLQNAALACKTAKAAGGSRVHLFQESDVGQIHQRTVMGWVYKIDNAIASNSFWLRGQKIAGIGNNARAKPLYELLLGVRDEQGQPISPGPLIEAGERFKKSSLIDRWVVEQALQFMERNPAALESSSGYHINLSAHSLNDDAFLDFLEQRLDHYRNICTKIVFEITETAAVANTHYTADFMLRLKRLGCRFALDDFGTGFSSYNYLQNLPVDYLKIDGTFVTDITHNMVNYAMVKSISELGRFLGMEVIAECVEDKATIDALKNIGVEWVQGYAISAPKPLDSGNS
ncbi:MAG: hypothetical protein CME36_10660 [unclassified Hahellaceae]|nr:hypothetical protein [Hahellaceae bacterium]|tara:strand:- start:50277 stop:54248 length:3972 start_codon:yes stop_codon:yes gene_type:complete